MNVWVVKATEKHRTGLQGWHWNEYLAGDHPEYGWGGPEWIRSRLSKKILRDEFSRGDILLCDQTDDYEYGRVILGLTRSVSYGIEDPPGSAQYNTFDIAPSNEALTLAPPLTIHELYGRGCHPKCFSKAARGTIFPVLPDDFRAIIGIIAERSDHEGERVIQWLRQVGFRSAFTAAEDDRDADEAPWDRECTAEDVDALLEEAASIAR
jgi:hypothetical protein